MICYDCCQDCLNVKCLTLPGCEEDAEYLLNLGTADPDTDYDVYIRNNVTGIVRRFSVTSDGTGQILLNLDIAETFLSGKSDFTIAISESGQTDPIEVEYENGLFYDCVTVTFKMLYDHTGFPVSDLIQYLQPL